MTSHHRSPADALRTAAAYIRRYGWHPGPGLYDVHDGCTHGGCQVVRSGMYPASMYGAIRAALVGAPKWYLTTTAPGVPEAYAATVDHLAHHLQTHGSADKRTAVQPWEQATGRTRDHVVTALLAAAATAPTAPFPPVRLAPVIPLPKRRPASDRTAGEPAPLFPFRPRRTA